jgi:NAD(P)-dependent dehydrogenase (short-subunit alcohol dehydrogenase family)
VELWGRLDVLINNAGAGIPMKLADASAERISRIYAVNVIGPTLLAGAAVPHLAAAKGTIINISSTLGRKPVPGFADYAASKAALEQLTRCWALELAPQGVRVNAVAAGPVETAFLESPPTFTWQYSLEILVALKVTISTGSCGAAKRSSARSRSGVMATIGTPRRDAARSEVIIRGLFVPGFGPITKIASVASKSASSTVPLPMPIF